MSPINVADFPQKDFPVVIRVGDGDDEGNIYTTELLSKIAEDAPEEYRYDFGAGTLMFLFRTIEEYAIYVSGLEAYEKISESMDLAKAEERKVVITTEDPIENFAVVKTPLREME